MYVNVSHDTRYVFVVVAHTACKASSIARPIQKRTFLCALRYVVVHANFAGFFFWLNNFLHLPFKNKKVLCVIDIRRHNNL